MTSRLKQEIRGMIGEGLTLSAILAHYEDEDQWQVRRFFAEVKKEEAVARVDAQFDMRATPTPQFTKKGIEAMNAGWLRPNHLSFKTLPPSKPLFQSGGKVKIVGADIHTPESDKHAMDLFYQIGRALGTDDVIIDGDWFSVNSLSKYTPSADQHLKWPEERAANMADYGGPVTMRQMFPDARIRFLPGNHDVRPISWVNANAMPLMGLMPLASWLGIDSPALNIEVVEDGIIELAEGNLVIKHGTAVSQHAGHSVKKEIDKSGTSVIMGHVHRRALVEVTKRNDILTGIELGCLCDLRPSYANKEDVVNWQQGFAVVTEFEDGDFEVELVRIRNGKATFRGKRFTSRFLGGV